MRSAQRDVRNDTCPEAGYSSRMDTERRYSLRRHVWWVVSLIAMVPLLFVTLGIPFDHLVRWRLRSRMSAAVDQCAADLRSGGSCADAARAHDVWLRVYVADELVEETDAASDASVSWMERLMELDSPHWLREQAPQTDGCEVTAFDRLLACRQTATVEVAGVPRRVVAIVGDVRSVRALSLDGVTKLALQVLLVALLVGWWLGRRIVDPIERLRHRVLERRGQADFDPFLTDDETEVGEVAEAFNELLGELDERRRANEAFAADLAHDLKTPIATVLSCAENMEHATGLETAEVRRHARVLRRSGERLTAVVEEFLELARAEAGLEQAHREPVAVADLLRAVADELSEVPDYRSSELSVEVRDASVLGSERHLRTAVMNVLENALQVTDDDGRVDVTVTARGDDIVITIRDDGPGIAPEDVDRVFDRFFSRRRGGTGLGLPLAHAVARAHGGDLSVSSPRGEGASFEFCLPSYESHTEMTDE